MPTLASQSCARVMRLVWWTVKSDQGRTLGQMKAESFSMNETFVMGACGLNVLATVVGLDEKNRVVTIKLG